MQEFNKIHELFKNKKLLVQQPYFQAIAVGNLDDFQRLLSGDAGLANRECEGVRPLHVAIVYQQMTCVYKVLEHLDLDSIQGNHWMRGDPLAEGSSHSNDTMSSELYSVLWLVAKYMPTVDLMNLLIKGYGLDPIALPVDRVNLLPKWGEGFPTLLDVCCEAQSLELVNYVLEHCNVDPNFSYLECNQTPLHRAVHSQRLDICQSLLLAGADPDKVVILFPDNQSGDSLKHFPLYPSSCSRKSSLDYASEVHNVELMKLLWIFSQHSPALSEKFAFLKTPEVQLAHCVALSLIQCKTKYRDHLRSSALLKKARYVEGVELLKSILNSSEYTHQLRALEIHLGRKAKGLGSQMKLVKLEPDSFDGLLLNKLFDNKVTLDFLSSPPLDFQKIDLTKKKDLENFRQTILTLLPKKIEEYQVQSNTKSTLSHHYRAMAVQLGGANSAEAAEAAEPPSESASPVSRGDKLQGLKKMKNLSLTLDKSQLQEQPITLSNGPKK